MALSVLVVVEGGRRGIADAAGSPDRAPRFARRMSLFQQHRSVLPNGDFFVVSTVVTVNPPVSTTALVQLSRTGQAVRAIQSHPHHEELDDLRVDEFGFYYESDIVALACDDRSLYVIRT